MWQNLKLHPSEHLAEWEILLQKRSTALLLVLSRFHKHCDNLSDCLASFVSLWPGSVQFCSIRPFITGAGAAFTVTQDRVHSSQSQILVIANLWSDRLVNSDDCADENQFPEHTYIIQNQADHLWCYFLFKPQFHIYRLQIRILCIASPGSKEEY